VGTRINNEHKYIPLTHKERFEHLKAFLETFTNFINDTKYDINGVMCSMDVLFEIFERVEMRKVYFHVFYNGKVMSEQNETALICFWILKLSPFFDALKRSKNLNATFAVYLFLSMLTRINRAKGRDTTFTREYVDNLRYAFLYRDISKEAIMLAADTFLA